MLPPALHSFAYALDYLREQVADVDPAALTAQPAGVTNHPAWVIGHLTFTCEMLAGALGVEPWLPADAGATFGTGSVPVSDPAAYETKDALLARLTDAQRRLTGAVQGLNESDLDAPFPEPALLDVFPTMRHALVQVLVGHTSMHVGQLTVWRRAMNLPAMSRSFE